LTYRALVRRISRIRAFGVALKSRDANGKDSRCIKGWLGGLPMGQQPNGKTDTTQTAEVD
jgi:hypothetical protein